MLGAILFYGVIGLPAALMFVVAVREFARSRAQQFSALRRT